MYAEKNDQNYAFFKFMHDIVDAGVWASLSNSSRALYPVLCKFTNEQFSFVWPATTELLRLTGFKTKKPLQQARRELVNAGLIDYIPGTGHNSSRYYFRFDYKGSRIHLDTYRDHIRTRRGRHSEPSAESNDHPKGVPKVTPNNNPNNIHINIHNNTEQVDGAVKKLDSIYDKLIIFMQESKQIDAPGVARYLIGKYDNLELGSAIKVALSKGKSGDVQYLESIINANGLIEVKHKERVPANGERGLAEEELIDILSPKYIYNKTLYCEKLTDDEYEHFMPACQKVGLKLKRISINEQRFA
jgi:hypothetical protein